MTQPIPYTRTTWFFKGCECLLAGIAVLSTSLVLLELLPRSFWERYPSVGDYVLPGLFGGSLLFSLIYSISWHRRERAGPVNSGLRHAWLQGLIRYFLAFTIALYGFGKIRKTQLQPSMAEFDRPISELTGYRLTWFYYGFSYPLILIIGVLQLGGGLLLLDRRTRLLGVMVLLPVMSNILLINLFYNIDPGALSTSVVILLGLVFLAWVDSARLRRASVMNRTAKTMRLRGILWRDTLDMQLARLR